MNRQQRVLTLFALLLMSAAMFGCANSSRVGDDRGSPTAYESDLERARTSIEDAERAGAAEFGLAELASARDKVRAAELAAEDDEDQRARQLAAEASVDAELATAITRNRKVQELLTEVRSGLQTLDNELRRNDAAGPARP